MTPGFTERGGMPAPEQGAEFDAARAQEVLAEAGAEQGIEGLETPRAQVMDSVFAAATQAAAEQGDAAAGRAAFEARMQAAA